MLFSFKSLFRCTVGIALISLTGCKFAPASSFVHLVNNAFELEGKPFFPIMLNYVAEFRYSENKYFLSPLKAYEHEGRYEHDDSVGTSNQLRGHFRLIREMGFNTIRICLDRLDSSNDQFYYPAGQKPLSIDKDRKIILNCMSDLLQIAGEEQLKVMILIKAPYEVDAFTELAKSILAEFSNEPTLFAYDFFNEPIYFDKQKDTLGNPYERPKLQAIQFVKGWRKLMDEFAPNQLFTIGFSEPIEVFEWDPSQMDVDFLCFHTYHPLRVPNEIYWFSKYCNKPWMIGETALPADDSLVSYADQQIFFDDVLQRVRNCNGIGLGWWEFQEIPGAHFEAQYAGILNRKGQTQTADGKFTIIGTPKPVVAQIQRALSIQKNADCICMPNYQNIVGYSNYLLQGAVSDFDTGLPIEGAVIRGWNQDWSVGLNTFTLEDGTFKMFSNDKCFHYELSAPGYVTFRFDKHINFIPITENSQLADVKLEYQKISYLPFIDSSSNKRSLFSFKNEMFNCYKFIAILPRIKLKKL